MWEWGNSKCDYYKQMNEGDIDDQQVESVSVSKINACSAILEVTVDISFCASSLS